MHGNSAFGSIAFDNYARRNALGADLIAGPLAYRLRAPKRQRKSGHTGYVFVTGVGLKRPTRRWRDAQKPQVFLGSFGWLDEATGLKTGRLGFVGILGLLAAWCLWGAVTRRATVKHGRVLGPAVRVFLELFPVLCPQSGPEGYVISRSSRTTLSRAEARLGELIGAEVIRVARTHLPTVPRGRIELIRQDVVVCVIGNNPRESYSFFPSSTLLGFSNPPSPPAIASARNETG